LERGADRGEACAGDGAQQNARETNANDDLVCASATCERIGEAGGAAPERDSEPDCNEEREGT
jgi:hypothetical protein